jgi:hypothetical protein
MEACMPPSFHFDSIVPEVTFDKYSDCNSSDIDSEEVDLKQAKNLIHDDVSTTSGDETHPWQSADEHTTACLSASSGDEQPWIQSHSKCGATLHNVDIAPGRQQTKVYPLALMLQIRTLLTVCQPPAGSLATKQVDQIASLEGTCKSEHKLIGKHRQAVSSKNDKHGGEERFLKSVRASLASLSMANVRTVAENLKDSGMTSLQHLSTLLQEVHNWATSQHAQAASAALCAELKTIRKVSSVAGSDGEPNSFRQLILDSCWPRFQEFLDQRNEATSADRRKGIATVKYISELILKGLVSPRMLITAAELLLETFKVENRFIEALEALVALLTATCPQIDNNPAWVHRQRMNVVFDGLGELAHKRLIPPSLCLLIGEVIALRQSGWCVGKARCQQSQMLTCVARSVEREPPKPKQHLKQAPTAQSSKTSMLSLAREMLLAPVASNQRKNKDVPNLLNQAMRAQRPVTTQVAATAPATKKAAVAKNNFNAVAFHRALSIVLRGLNSDGDVVAAVQKIQEQKVPQNQQAKEYADLLTRACEISRKAVRTSAFGLAAGLAAEPCVFDPAECLKGLRMFFNEVYPDLCEEVSDLGTIIRTEMFPSLRAAFPGTHVESLLPLDL